MDVAPLSNASDADNCLKQTDLSVSGRTKDIVSGSAGAPEWYVMRDLKRSNARVNAYTLLKEDDFEVFTPLHTKIIKTAGGTERRELPLIPDLLFVRALRSALDPVVERIPTLQYRYVKGAPFRTPMTVATREMDRFIAATTATPPTRYYAPGEITPEMYGRRIRIIGGPLDGQEGRLLKLKGLRKRHILIDLPNLLTAAIEVAPEFILLL